MCEYCVHAHAWESTYICVCVHGVAERERERERESAKKEYHRDRIAMSAKLLFSMDADGKTTSRTGLASSLC